MEWYKGPEFKQNDRQVILGFSLKKKKKKNSSPKNIIYKNIRYNTHQLAMLVLRIHANDEKAYIIKETSSKDESVVRSRYITVIFLCITPLGRGMGCRSRM